MESLEPMFISNWSWGPSKSSLLVARNWTLTSEPLYEHNVKATEVACKSGVFLEKRLKHEKWV
jgi:hypothetical protein